MLKLFLINCRGPVVDAFIAQGHTVKSINVSETVFDAAEAISKCEFSPDVLIQQENLGRRLFLKNLSSLSCLKIFWSVDTHLNFHWHSIYARLFDSVLTTQKKYLSKFKKCGIPAFWVPWMGVRPGTVSGIRGIKPYSSRKYDMTFIGRVSDSRRSRKWFVEFLSSQYDLNCMDGLNYSEMMGVYRDTRIVPNEAILNEVNFRLFEAASCACAVVTPDVGEELGELFDVGREIEIYSNAVELKDIVDRLSKDTKAAEMMALKGYARILEDHLPDNRVRSIVDIAGSTTKNVLNIRDEFRITALMHAALLETGNKFFEFEDVCNWLVSAGRSMETDTALIRLYALSGNVEKVWKTASSYIKNDKLLADSYSCMSFSLSCWRSGYWDLAKIFWYEHCGKKKIEVIVKPENETELLVLWAKELFKSGWIIRSGVVFDEKKDVPACAIDCLSSAFYLSPKNLDISKLMEIYLDKAEGMQFMRVGFLSHLSLYFPNDWRVAFELAAASLETFRFEQGLSELKNAESLAQKQGYEKIFRRLLNYRKIGSASGLAGNTDIEQ
ncbi:glycosyltransferase [Maridesulfovibrio bastinii]|uniref:glycosyltransferase family protein n=1 Tax=Maridesulfovibrio bastinii TaxID=47157 RepID=UPI00041E5C0F|nr:glycosyltransferase [Maridesulfovibrio bastinii]